MDKERGQRSNELKLRAPDTLTKHCRPLTTSETSL